MVPYLSSSSDTLSFYFISAAWGEKIFLLTRQFDIYIALKTTHTKPPGNLEVMYAGLTCIEEIASGFKWWILISQGKNTYTGFDSYE